MPGWKVIARLRNGCLETVQTQAAGSGTLAYVGLSAPRDFRRVDRARVHFPYPGDSRLLSVVTSHDQSQKGSTLLLASRRSVSGMDRYYRRTLVHQGWVLEMNRKLPDGDVALIFQRGAEEADVALSHDADGSEAVINVVHH